MTEFDQRDAEWMGPWEDVIDRIAKEASCGHTEAEGFARKLSRIHPSLRPEVLRWWSAGEVDRDREIQGYSVRRLIAENKCTFVIDAFKWLSSLLETPEETKKRLDEFHNFHRSRIIFD